jgi:glycosyltransferase involved in cell wall biosynthesis
MNAPLLYITYDGLLEPLGQSQVLAYQEKLAAGRTVHILSFEKPDDWRDDVKRRALAARIAAAGIHWHPRRYHKRPSALATAYDIGIGIASGLWLILRHRIGIVHARSYVPALMALVLKRLTGARFLFDMRGFWADERVDGGLWPKDGRLYRVAKGFEKRFLLRADHVVSLTHAAVREMEKFPYLQGRMPAITVIPTCADLTRFSPGAAPAPEPFVLGYVGSAGTWYLFDETVRCFAELRRLKPDCRLLIVNRREHTYIRERLLAGGIDPASVTLRSAEHTEIPALLRTLHASVFFIKPVFSKQASAPTKLAELLGCGVPCLGNAGVGDMADVLDGEGVGVAVPDFTPKTLHDGLQRLLALAGQTDIRARCRAAAERHFSLDAGVAAYAGVYRALTEPGHG